MSAPGAARPAAVVHALEEASGLLEKRRLLEAKRAFYRARDLSGRDPEVMREIANRWKQGGWTATMAGNDPEAGEAMFHNARAITAELAPPDRAKLCEIARGMAIARGKLGEHEDALQLCAEAEEVAPDDEARAKIFNTRAVTLSYIGRLDEARVAAETALRLATTDPTRKVARQSLGVVALRRGDTSEALRLLEDEVLRAWALVESGDFRGALRIRPGTRPRAWTLRARAWLGLGRPARALAELRRAGTIVEDGRARLETAEARAAFLGSKQEISALLVRVCAGQKRWREAFAHAEAARARSFFESVVEHTRRLHAHLTGSERARLEKLRAEAEGLQAKPRRTADEERRLARLEREERLALRRYDQEEAATRRLPRRPALTAAEACRQIPAGTAIVQYHVGDDGICAFVLKRGSFQGLRLGADPAEVLAAARDLPRALALARRDERSPGAAFFEWHFGLLGSALLGDLPLDGVKRLVVVPHGPLHFVPFAALRLGGRYLIERFPLVLAPSTTVALALAPRGRTVRAPRRCLFVKDPTGTLPHAEGEATALARRFRGAVTTLAGPEATRGRVQAAAAGCDLLHFATHAVFRPESPEFSYLELADGRLSARDVLRYPFGRARLAILSACDSGRGDFARAGEMFGLPRAFLQAGAASVLATLWPIEDHAAIGSFMDALYASGFATHEAQRQAIAAGVHPSLWAAWVQIGG